LVSAAGVASAQLKDAPTPGDAILATLDSPDTTPSLDLFYTYLGQANLQDVLDDAERVQVSPTACRL
jgi:hypothetical protein